MKKLLNETFNIQFKNIVHRSAKDNNVIQKKVPIAYIEASNGDNTFRAKEIFKQYGAKWDEGLKLWYWPISDENKNYTVDTYIKPCINQLIQIEKNPNNEKRDFVQVVDELLALLDKPVANLPEMEANAYIMLESKLVEFKKELIKSLQDHTFQEKFLPIIKFNKAQGRPISIHNTILIWIQNPHATLVKSRQNWYKVNKGIKKGATPIYVLVPITNTYLSKEEKKVITQKFLKDHNAKTIKDLSIADREQLDVLLRSGTNSPSNIMKFKYGPVYDFKDTYQLAGKEDIVGDGSKAKDIQWYDDSGEETKESVQLIDALISVIQASGIKMEYASYLNGARGVSKSGYIAVLKGATKNIGMFNTLVHEYSHEKMHQTYLKTHNPDYEEFFVRKQTDQRSDLEQQAELCAWIVLMNFGYNMETNLNYVTLWGLNEDNAMAVFDTVSKTASSIIFQLANKLNTTMNESKLNHIYEAFMPSGFELAKMLGKGKLYIQSAEQEEEKDKIEGNEPQVDEQYISNVVSECIDKFINQLM